MAYTPYTWQNLPNVTTPISKANLDHLETQYTEMINLFNAHTILMAIADNTPAPLTMGASTILARLAAGNIVAATPAQLMALLSGQAGAEFLFNTQKIGGVVDPTTDQQVATKKYVDDYKIIATGNYTGNDAAGRQITVGFKCSLVIIGDNIRDQWIVFPSSAVQHRGTAAYHIDVDAFLSIHGTDGFTVDVNAGCNTSPVVYYYWAISE